MFSSRFITLIKSSIFRRNQTNVFCKKRPSGLKLYQKETPIKFANFLRTPILKKSCERLLVHIVLFPGCLFGSRLLKDTAFSVKRSFRKSLKKKNNSFRKSLKKKNKKPSLLTFFSAVSQSKNSKRLKFVTSNKTLHHGCFTKSFKRLFEACKTIVLYCKFN